MQITLDIPADLAQYLAADPETLSRIALEALALGGVRSGKLTSSQARRLLRIQSRYQMDGFLKDHQVYLPIALEDVRRESELTIAFSK